MTAIVNLDDKILMSRDSRCLDEERGLFPVPPQCVQKCADSTLELGIESTQVAAHPLGFARVQEEAGTVGPSLKIEG